VLIEQVSGLGTLRAAGLGAGKSGLTRDRYYEGGIVWRTRIKACFALNIECWVSGLGKEE
jgi:hypothetical protein